MNQQPSHRGGFRIRSHAHRSVDDCHVVDQSIDEYALGILEPSQRAAIERHLTGCPACSSLIVSYQQTAAVLALAVPLVSPPASARTALLTRISITPQTAAPRASVYTGSLDALRTPTLPASHSIAAAPTTPETTTQEAQSAWWRIYAAPLATLPLLLALGLVAAWGVNNYSQLHSSQSALAQRDMQISRLSSQLSNTNSQSVANLVTSPSAKRYTLAPEINGADDGAQGVLFADSQSDQAALQVTGLPPGTYAVVVQLQNGDMVPKTEFMVGVEGSATTMVDLGSQVTDLKSVHIRPTTAMTESDVAVVQQIDVLMATIGPDISGDSDTSAQNP